MVADSFGLTTVVKSEEVMKLTQNPYTQAHETLGVRKLATQKEIRAAWRCLAMETHPDRPDGSTEAFGRVNAAYDLLKKQGNGKRWQPEAEPEYARESSREPTGEPIQRRVSRPKIKTNVVNIDADLAALCQESLEQFQSDETDGSDEDRGEHDHIPQMMRKCGRRVSYIVDSELKRGTNRVSLPVDKSLSGVNCSPEVLDLKVANDGRATIDVPESVRTSKFPGAQSVRIHFATV